MTKQTTPNRRDEDNILAPTGGLPVCTDLRAGLAWDDLDDQAQSLWHSLTSTISGVTGGSDAS